MNLISPIRAISVIGGRNCFIFRAALTFRFFAV